MRTHPLGVSEWKPVAGGTVSAPRLSSPGHRATASLVAVGGPRPPHPSHQKRGDRLLFTQP